jgi:hypothetical protein
MYIVGLVVFVVVAGFVLQIVGRRARKVDLGVVSSQWINEQRMQPPNPDR